MTGGAGAARRLSPGSMDVPFRKRFRRVVRSVVLVALLRAVSLTPLGPALRMGGWGGAVAYRLFGKTRRLALLHLGMAFPEKTEAERQVIARQMFVNLGLSPTRPSPSAATTSA